MHKPSKSKPSPKLHLLLPKPTSFLTLLILCNILLLCGDIHPNPGPPTKIPPFSFCHLNTRSILAINDTGPRLHHIEQELTIDNKYNVLAMTETHLANHISDNDLSINNYQIFRKDRNRHGGGVCIYVENSIAASRLPHLEQDNIDMLWLKLNFNAKVIYFGVCYRPPGQSVQDRKDFLDLLESHLEQVLALCRNSHSLILTGDFNDRTTDWHSAHLESELGQDLYNLTNNLYLQQLINEPTRNNNILDLLFTNNPALLTDTGVLDPIHDLDHCPIYGKLNYSIKSHNKPFSRKIWNYSAGDFAELNRQISQIPWGMVIGETNDVDDAVDMMTNLITQCCNNCIPNKTIKIYPRDKPGMTHQVKQLFKTTRRLHRRAQRSKLPADIEKHKTARRKAKLAWREAEHDYYQGLITKLQNTTYGGRHYWSIIKCILNTNKSDAIPCIIDGESIATSNREKAEILNKFFAAQSTMTPLLAHHELPPFQYLTNNRLQDIQTSTEEVYKMLTHLDTTKASGPDFISNKILKEAATSLSEPLSDLFNKGFSQGKFPKSWKHANVTPIHKKGDRQNKSNYRPIALLSNISKLKERIMYKRLYEHCMTNNLLTEKNSGFKRLDSTINRLVHITHELYNNLDQKMDTLIVFLDISKAFDRVWHPGLLFKLRQFGITGSLYECLASYLSNRNQKVVIGGEESSIQTTNAGVPQGSILGPLLFLIFINDIVSVVENPMFLFADDSSLMNAFININTALPSINRDLQHLTSWAQTWRVTFNPQKTVFMIISKKSNPPTPALYMDNVKLKQVDQECYLGMVITKNLSWKSHINKLIAKAFKRIGLLFRLKTNRLPRAALSNYYITFIRPVLEYGSVVFDNCTAHECHLLEQVQRRAAVLCTGAFKRSNYKLLLEDLGWDSLQNRRKTAKLTLMYKILHDLTPRYLKDLIPPQVQTATAYTLRNRNNYRLPSYRTQCMNKSFIPATIQQWNVTDTLIQNCNTLCTFKSKFKFQTHPLLKLYSSSFGPSTKYLTQIRLGLSKLKLHLFTHGIVPDPFCPNCQIPTKESPAHYLLECPAIAAVREEMFHGLRGLMPAQIMNNNKKLLHCLIFGHTALSLETNINMFLSVITFISASSRFNQID